LRNTGALLLGVGAGTLALGCGLAWLTARCEFRAGAGSTGR